MLNYEERLTKPHAGEAVKQVASGWTKYWTKASKFEMMNRLGQYEDTGLTPEEINALKKRS